METERDPHGDRPTVSTATTQPVRVHTLSLWSRGGHERPAPPDEPTGIPDVVFASDDRWYRNGPLLLVLLAVAFNLWAFRAEARTVEYGNDMVLHTQMVTLAHHLISLGRIPLGQWYPFMAQGSSLFVQYQSFSAILTGAVSSVIGVRLAMSLSLYLLFSLWPISVYFSGRLLGFGRWVAGVAAVMAPLLWSINIRGFEIRAYAWNGAGLWSQLWAMWTLPLAWGFCWRYVSQRRYLAGAVITLALTIAFHFITAYLAVLALVILVVVSPRQLAARLRRAAVVGVGAVLASIWILVPFFADVRWTSVDGAELGTTVVNSYGAPTVLKWLVTGNLYDHGRVPIITFFVAVGLVVCLRRWRVDERARVVVGLWVLSLLLFFGRPTLGPLLNVLPDSGRLLLQRYVSGVQLAGLFMAGVGAVTVARWIAASIEARVRRR
ncbi:MAG: hypothetical protein ACRDV0_05580, partial [Acidimicrobiales bacterium]